MRIIGVTGNIASGKTYFSSILRRTFRCKIFDADKVVHALYQNDISVTRAINDAISTGIRESSIDRKRLLAAIIRQPSLLQKIEEIVHPNVKAKLTSFIKLCKRDNTRIIVLDIPLLFEIAADKICDTIIILQSSKITNVHRLRKRYNDVQHIKPLHRRKFILPREAQKKIRLVPSGADKRELFKYVYSSIARNPL
ncbi:dephospho-CoA kinase [Neorickettsia helminthoeca str. Oregon]|uniref:Dephospho-CoA kinase n=1 Tax=Neorickettsia helminthoeca str. Oregon TaxID=1286528 RepID=X5HLH8_9RICK|nr:dephospho-CoA kinase [Neorickettsia helminthoeca]AHX11250.1 dephospho-CoA kinase [Neorickettsia helminthoeca str. Oregon]